MARQYDSGDISLYRGLRRILYLFLAIVVIVNIFTPDQTKSLPTEKMMAKLVKKCEDKIESDYSESTYKYAYKQAKKGDYIISHSDKFDSSHYYAEFYDDNGTMYLRLQLAKSSKKWVVTTVYTDMRFVSPGSPENVVYPK